jgi:hypothetical protein
MARPRNALSAISSPCLPLSKLERLWQALCIAPRLGIANIGRVTCYKLLCRAGHYRRRLPVGASYPGPFFLHEGEGKTLTASSDGTTRADRVLDGDIPFYSHAWRPIGSPPLWPGRMDSRHWSHIDEFATGDIKDEWEPSRFAGLVLLAQAAAAKGEKRYSDACEHWLISWVSAHPWNAGYAWKCAQETALRLMAAIIAADMLERHAGMRPAPAMLRFVREHARRIGPTMLYAVAQDNNHATSESSGLYIAGAYLLAHGVDDSEARGWLRAGRHGIENLIPRLIATDGSFSQHSLTYHRLMLDTMAMAEVWRRRAGGKPWSEIVRHRLGLAATWLERLTDPHTGDAPNLGANDGARLFAQDPVPFRDFRTSADLATRLFLGRRARFDGIDPTLASTLDIEDGPLAQASDYCSPFTLLPEGGYAVWRTPECCMLLRLPCFRFRPSHSDILHLNLQWRGVDVLRDGGSYGYNSTPDRSPYFAGVESHNTIQFDNRDQMPRLSRFLWGAWPRGRWEATGPSGIAATYTDWRGASHTRHVTMTGSVIQVDDDVAGFLHRATLRWRLPPGDWGVDQGRVAGGNMIVEIRGNPDLRIRIVPGDESRHYQEASPVCVIEAETSMPGRISTRLSLK